MGGSVPAIVRWLVGGAAVVGAAVGNAEPDAAERLERTLQSATSSSAVLRAELAETGREVAARRAAATLAPASIEWLREGIGPSFDERPNAQDTVAVAREFRLPGQATAAGELRDGLGRWSAASRSASRWRFLGRVAAGWVDLAAATERVAIVEERWSRLDRALALQEARYQLGEISGSDVAQLDLEHVRESSRLARLRAERAALEASLRRLVGGEIAAPAPGDLEELVGRITAGEASPPGQQAAVSGPEASSARAAAEASAASARLASRTVWGQPEVAIEWERIPPIDGAPGFDAVGAGIRVPLPFGAGGRDRRAAARAAEEAASARLEAELALLALRTEAASARQRGAADRLVALRPALATLARTEESLEQQFRLGVLTYLVYIDALSRLDDIRLEAVESRRELLEARLDLAAATGDKRYFPLPGEPVQEGS